ncbi:MAG: O-antigen ligase family protein [Crocinitomicaceae bacterium]
MSALLFTVALCLLLVAPVYNPITLSAWVLITIILAVVNKGRIRFKWLYIWPILLYGIYALGLLWTQNMDDGSFDLEVKMSLAILPFFFMLTDYSKQQLKIIIISFLFCLIGYLLYLFFIGFQTGFSQNNFSPLFYTNFTPDIHPAYLGFYINISAIILIVDYIRDDLKLFKRKWINPLLFLFLGLVSIFVLSKIGIITTFVLGLILLGYWIKIRKKWLAISVFFLFAGIVTFTYLKSEYIQTRVSEFVEGVGDGPDDNYLYSTSLRVKIWQVAWEKYAEAPVIGYGTGDVGDVLQAIYVEREIKRAPDLHLNAHNQFLQTALGIGITGIVVLMIMLIHPIIRFKANHGYGAGLSIITFLFFMTESVLETQAGVVGFICFYCLLNGVLENNMNSKHKLNKEYE